MKIVYIAGSFRGANSWEIHNNVLKAERAVVDLIGKGYAPICPHKMGENLQGLYSDETYLEICFELLRKCDVLYMLRDWQDSEGSRAEFSLATELGIEIIFEED